MTRPQPRCPHRPRSLRVAGVSHAMAGVALRTAMLATSADVPAPDLRAWPNMNVCCTSSPLPRPTCMTRCSAPAPRARHSGRDRRPPVGWRCSTTHSTRSRPARHLPGRPVRRARPSRHRHRAGPDAPPRAASRLSKTAADRMARAELEPAVDRLLPTARRQPDDRLADRQLDGDALRALAKGTSHG